GVEVGRENGYIRVISPIDDSPADRAGIKAGDLIIQIDNKPLREMLPEEAAGMMRGKPGTDVTVTIAREGQEPFDLTITREVIALTSVRSRILIPGYTYIRISQFRVNTGDDLEAEIEELFEEHGELKGIILDLRDNPGGVLQASVQVVDSFISEGRIVYTEGRLEEVGMEFSATRKNVAGDVPM
ncbi:MAG TPA: peptidase S41, partial [Erythrobacter sp.]|nr:peptidase S41 [Erythrobacter sp.]